MMGWRLAFDQVTVSRLLLGFFPGFSSIARLDEIKDGGDEGER
jgi:hypothetical protein